MPEIVVGTGFAVWALAVVVSAVPCPRLSRTLLSVLFLLMGLVNGITAVSNPAVYENAYAETAMVPLYRAVLVTVWAEHNIALTLAVGILNVVLGVAVLIPGRTRRAGLLGAIVFLLAVAPTAPENLVNVAFAVGAALLLRGEVAARARPPDEPSRPDRSMVASAR